MTITVSYVVVTGGNRTSEFVARFVSSWLRYPPDHPVRIIASCNGGPVDWEVGAMLNLVGADFYPRKNEGADIGAHMDVAKRFPADMQICLGETCFLHRSYWMDRLLCAWRTNGPGLYGFLASNLVTKHLNSTCFALDPKLFDAWSYPVETREQRYQFEHSRIEPFWKRVRSLGRPVRLVTFEGDYGPDEWRATRNAFWQGDQSNALVHCIHTQRFANASPETKARWTAHADRGMLSK